MIVLVLLFISEGFSILWPKVDYGAIYKKYQIWKLNVTNVNLTTEFEQQISKKDVLHRSDNNIDFLLNGNETEYWNKFLKTSNISYAVLLDDVQKAIEREDLMKKNCAWRRDGSINWASYAKLNDIYEYLKHVAASNPGYCTLQTIGQTAHKKKIQMLKLSTGKSSNRAFLIEAGMHGREWVSVSSILYFIEHIAWNFTKQPDYIQNKDWYIIAVSNPDGYEYSMTKDRMWRKNRRRFSGECDGVDLNRNFDINWSQSGHDVNVVCSIHYCGPEPFSEPETVAIKNVIVSRHFSGYVGIHSYASMVFYPWAYSGKPTGDVALHTKVGKEMVLAMRAVAGEHFVTGTVTRLKKEKASGMALDWMYSQGVQHSYLMETRGGRSANFFLEPNQILPAAKEITEGLMAMGRVIV